MKRSMLLVLAGAALAMGGCAAIGGSRATSYYGSDVDIGKVIAVNQWAETKGATVVWVNYPRKAKTAESSNTVN